MNLLETLHQNLVDIADSNEPTIKKAVHFGIKKNETTNSGLDKIAGEGSSRIVYDMTEPKKITLDGIETHIPTVLKVARKSTFDLGRYSEGKEAMGVLQNEHEAKGIHNEFSIFKRNSDGTYTTNENGILAPTMDTHKTHFYNEMIKAHPFDDRLFMEHTKTKEHPYGISFDEMKNSVNNLYHNGQFSKLTGNGIHNHPYVKAIMSHVEAADMNPVDIQKDNFGIIEHPITGKKYPVMIDYGYSNHVSGEY